MSNKRDELSIFFDDGTPLCPPLSGNRFPSTPCLIRGNSIMLHFESGSDKKRKLWGYKLTVTGWKMFREIKMPRMVDMYRTLCHLVGKVNTFLLSVDYIFFLLGIFPVKINPGAEIGIVWKMEDVKSPLAVDSFCPYCPSPVALPCLS